MLGLMLIREIRRAVTRKNILVMRFSRRYVSVIFKPVGSTIFYDVVSLDQVAEKTDVGRLQFTNAFLQLLLQYIIEVISIYL